MDNASQVLDKHFDNKVIKLPWVIMTPLCGVKEKAVYYAICTLTVAFNLRTYMEVFK